MQNIDSGLNDSHQRRLAAILTDMEENLANVERAAFTTSTSPFAQTSPDLTPTQQQVVGDYLRRIREIIATVAPLLGRHGENKRVAASWSIQNALHFVDIAIAEMGASYLRGYGAPGPQGIAILERIQSELRRPVLQLRAYLEQDLGHDPAARLARLQEGMVDLEILRTLERIIRERGLVDLRPALEALLQELESFELEIAVFGRVSSGKSSLLNTVLGADLLPVGVTPVTAVPTRIHRGEKALARISFAEKPDETIPIARLHEFVSEAGNPENAKRVTRASVEAPLDRLRGSIVFVDTPGIGSLTMSGERQTRSYLPRCDLGVLLVDGALTAKDLELLRLLYESGIPGIVALSKVDLIEEPDRDRLKAHAESEIRRALSLDLQVGLVSIAPSIAGLAQAWFDTEITPRLQQAQSLREESIRRKLGHLRESAAAILSVYLRDDAVSDVDELQDLDAQAQAALRDVLARARELSGNADAFSQLAIRNVADALAVDEPDDARRVILKTIRAGLERARRDTEQSVLDARDRLRTFLARMGDLAGAPVHPEDIRLGLAEVPSLEPHVGAVEVKPPRGLFRNLAIRSLERTLREELGAGVENAFRQQAQELAGWAKHQLAHLEQQFSTQARPLLARSSAATPNSKLSDIAEDLRALGYDR